MASATGTASWFGIGYDATNPKGNRRSPGARVLSEDGELRDLARRLLTTTNRDLVRNFAIAGFMVRKHLDYVSTFRFRAKTGNKDLDREIQSLMEWWARPENCDSCGRHSLQDLMRMWESHRTIDGDCLINRVKTGKLQTIEGDRIQTFGGIPFSELGIDDPQWVINGVWVNEYFKSLGYMVFRRLPGWNGMEFDRMIPARFADLFGYYGRTDQVRGISPLASAANTLRDVYESFDYAILKAKVSQFFAMQVTRSAADQFGEVEEVEGDDLNPDGTPKKRYDVRLGTAPTLTEMDPGDEIKVIESQTPSTQFQGFTAVMIMVAMKSLDLPFSFFDESHTNFAGSRMAGIQYQESASIKRHRLKQLLDKITAWRLGLFIADGDLVLPKGFSPSDLKWNWTHSGVPLFDPMKETAADVAAVNAGFASPQHIHAMRGTDFEAAVDEIAEAQAYAELKGVILSTALPSSAALDPNKSATKTEDKNVEQAAAEDAANEQAGQTADEQSRAERKSGMWRW